MTVDPEKAIILWPTYFDQRASREDGRRVPRRDAVEGLVNLIPERFDFIEGRGIMMQALLGKTHRPQREADGVQLISGVFFETVDIFSAPPTHIHYNGILGHKGVLLY